MFFTYADKQNSGLIDGWSPRYIGFDTTRRYLYYSENLKSYSSLPSRQPSVTGRAFFAMDGQRPVTSGEVNEFDFSVTTPHTFQAAMFHVVDSPTSADGEPRVDSPVPVKWKGKVKVESFAAFARLREVEHSQHLYQVEVQGYPRELASHEAPSEHLLSPSTGLGHFPEPFPAGRKAFFNDPYGFRELFQRTHDASVERRRARELAVAHRHASGVKSSEEPRGPLMGTIRSPTKRHEFISFVYTKSLTFRFDCEYNYARFLFILGLVLGYDQLQRRPYNGFPPLDPRCGVSMCPLPAHAAYFLDHVTSRFPYVCVFGHLIGHSPSGELQITLKNGFLIVTSDLVLAARSAGSVPTWVYHKSIQEFRYNNECGRPYVAFLTDDGVPDIIFCPGDTYRGEYLPNVKVPEAIEIERIRHVMHESCFGNVEARRVISFQPAKEATIRGFVAAQESAGRHFDFELASQKAGTPCPEGCVSLRDVWRTAGITTSGFDMNTIENAAVPIYDTHANKVPVAQEQLAAMQQLVEDHNYDSELVGLPLDSVTALPLLASTPGGPSSSLLEGPPLSATPSYTFHRHNHGGSASSSSSTDNDEPYSVPGARYLAPAVPKPSAAT